MGSTTAYGGSGQNTYSYVSGDGALTISTNGGTNTLLWDQDWYHRKLPTPHRGAIY